jgi:hypothetical protein
MAGGGRSRSAVSRHPSVAFSPLAVEVLKLSGLPYGERLGRWRIGSMRPHHTQLAVVLPDRDL